MQHANHGALKLLNALRKSRHAFQVEVVGRLIEEKDLGGSEEGLGQEHPDTLMSMNNLAILYYGQGRYAEAEPLYLESLDSGIRILGEAHPENLPALVNLAGDTLAYSEGDGPRIVEQGTDALVTDIDWIRKSAKLFGSLMPTEVMVFDVDDLDDAKKWILT